MQKQAQNEFYQVQEEERNDYEKNKPAMFQKDFKPADQTD